MTKTFQPITGSIPALVTPMLEDGSVDYASLRKLIDWHIAEGTDCIGVVGTTGESPTVNVEEHREIIRVSVEQAKGRVPIMAGCGANSTAEAIELAKFAKSVGAKKPLATLNAHSGSFAIYPKNSLSIRVMIQALWLSCCVAVKETSV